METITRHCSVHHVARRRSSGKTLSAAPRPSCGKMERQLADARARYDDAHCKRSIDEQQRNIRRLAREWTPTGSLYSKNAPVSVSQALRKRRVLASTASLQAL